MKHTVLLMAGLGVLWACGDAEESQSSSDVKPVKKDINDNTII